MGLFSKKVSPHEEKVDAAYRCYKAELVDMLFPGGKSQLSDFIKSIAVLCNIQLSNCTKKDYYDLSQIYVAIFNRKPMPHLTDETIASSLIVKYGEIVKTRETATQIVNYYNFQDNSLKAIAGAQDINLENPSTMARFNEWNTARSNALNVIDMLNRNSDKRNARIADPDFGLSKTNPIYVVGPDCVHIYLRKLTTEAGFPIEYKRIAKEAVDGIDGKVCTYEITTQGYHVGNLYINMRSSGMSSGVPKGYKAKDDLVIPDNIKKLIQNRAVLSASMNYYDTEEIELGLQLAQQGKPQKPKDDN